MNHLTYDGGLFRIFREKGLHSCYYRLDPGRFVMLPVYSQHPICVFLFDRYIASFGDGSSYVLYHKFAIDSNA